MSAKRKKTVHSDPKGGGGIQERKVLGVTTFNLDASGQSANGRSVGASSSLSRPASGQGYRPVPRPISALAAPHQPQMSLEMEQRMAVKKGRPSSALPHLGTQKGSKKKDHVTPKRISNLSAQALSQAVMDRGRPNSAHSAVILSTPDITGTSDSDTALEESAEHIELAPTEEIVVADAGGDGIFGQTELKISTTQSDVWTRFRKRHIVKEDFDAHMGKSRYRSQSVKMEVALCERLRSAVEPRLRSQVFNDLFEDVIVKDTAYGPLLRRIKNEYDSRLHPEDNDTLAAAYQQLQGEHRATVHALESTQSEVVELQAELSRSRAESSQYSDTIEALRASAYARQRNEMESHQWSEDKYSQVDRLHMQMEELVQQLREADEREAAYKSILREVRRQGINVDEVLQDAMIADREEQDVEANDSTGATEAFNAGSLDDVMLAQRPVLDASEKMERAQMNQQIRQQSASQQKARSGAGEGPGRGPGAVRFELSANPAANPTEGPSGPARVPDINLSAADESVVAEEMRYVVRAVDRHGALEHPDEDSEVERVMRDSGELVSGQELQQGGGDEPGEVSARDGYDESAARERFRQPDKPEAVPALALQNVAASDDDSLGSADIGSSGHRVEDGEHYYVLNMSPVDQLESWDS